MELALHLALKAGKSVFIGLLVQCVAQSIEAETSCCGPDLPQIS